MRNGAYAKCSKITCNPFVGCELCFRAHFFIPFISTHSRGIQGIRSNPRPSPTLNV